MEIHHTSIELCLYIFYFQVTSEAQVSKLASIVAFGNPVHMFLDKNPERLSKYLYVRLLQS